MFNKYAFLILALAFAGCGDDSKDLSSQSSSNLESRRFLDRETDSYDITDKFGTLTIQTGEYTYKTETKPWSSWWFPSIDRELFSNDRAPAPLTKYDEYVSLKHSEVAESAYYEETELYNPMQASWAGLCHAWAVASVLHREPSRSINKQGLTFTVADQKALLLKSYENVSKLEIYGERYDGLHDNQFKDIHPDQFHKFFQYYLGEEKKPFIMDYDPSYPVWTVPVYIAKTQIVKQDSRTMSVTSWITYASPFVEKNFVGTRNIVKTYTYNLYGSMSGGLFKVTDSEWTGSSVHDHPDYVIGFPKAAVRGSYNKELKVGYIDEILKY